MIHAEHEDEDIPLKQKFYIWFTGKKYINIITYRSQQSRSKIKHAD